eukprot:GFKZ01005750.1.p1 GENE.GFKZ01005750.1~~GFKZ01005750.1.p1  ORF type:complete len:477 (+),score=40.43 GFKZ01005750.1:374-1804(+)
MQSVLHADVAIVGAGLAGLSAAVRLQSLGVQPLVLEAQSQPGGRVSTLRLSPSQTIEMGATWFHGTEGNAAFDIALEAKLLQKPDREVDEGVSYTKLVLSTDGKLVMEGTTQTLSSDQMIPIADSYVDALALLEKASYRDLPDRSVQDHIREKSGWDRMTGTQKSIFRCCDLLEAAVNGCNGGTGELSSTRLMDYVTLGGDNVEPPQGGMTSIVNTLLSKLNRDCLLLNAEAESVSWGGPDDKFRPSIKLRDGGTVLSRCVIWTPSLNVTKRACNTGLFNPELPMEKVRALEGREQGIVEKAIAVLERGIENVIPNCAMPIVWVDEPPIDGREQRSHWSRGIYALTYDDRKQTITFWPSGEFAQTLCLLDDQEARLQVEQVLSMLYDQEVRLRKLVVTNWSGNPFVRGSYSFPAVGCDANAVQTIASPLPSVDRPLLCFAGEATHEKYFSTMHGAIESGYREADRCASFLAASEAL